PTRPPAGGGRIKREHIVWGAAVLVIIVLGFALAALVAQRRVNDKEKGQLLGQAESGGSVLAVGPLDGTDLGQYVAERQTALAKASGERVAVVSLNGYVTA